VILVAGGKMLTRRRLFEDALKVWAGLTLTPSARGFAAAEAVQPLRLGKAGPVPLPGDFLGLGYEMSSVARLGLLSATNDRYVHLLRALGAEGVLRVGGIVADYTRYEADGAITAEPKNTVITGACLEQINGFLREVGWSAIWSLNFAQGSLEDAVREASAVAAALGPRLLALELGNEVENYGRGDRPFRKPPYAYETYRREFGEWRGAILKAVPGARFAAPDTASSVEWVERMAADARGDVQLLTTHYYRGGQKQGTADQLLHADPKLRESLVRLRAASERSGIPWRMCETNSFFGGGRPGVSDTFVGTLWTLDFLLLLAEYGCAGINLETGVNQLGFISSYSPIQDDGKGINSAGAPYYGMLAFAVARRDCKEVRTVQVPEAAQDLTAYALGTAGTVRSVVILNRGDRDVHVSVAEMGMAHPSAMRLTGASGSSGTEVTFAGARVDEGGRWSAKTRERANGADLEIPRMSAVVLRD